MPLNVDLLNAGSILVQGSPIVSLYETGSGYCSTLRTGINSSVSGSCSVIAGGDLNTINEVSCNSVISGGRQNKTLARYSTVGGGRCNNAGVTGTVGGWYGSTYTGGLNTQVWEGPFQPSSTTSLNGTGVLFRFFFFGSGNVNLDLVNGGSGYVDGDIITFDGNLFGGSFPADNVTITVATNNYGYATVGGGRENTASGEYSTISGGYENTASGYASTISGGYRNTAFNDETTISGGYGNKATCRYATISGGYNNTASGYNSIIAGGYNNTASCYATGILGGRSNCVNHECSFIVGVNISSQADCTLHINCLHFSNIPTSAVGLAPGTVWNDSGMLCIV